MLVGRSLVNRLSAEQVLISTFLLSILVGYSSSPGCAGDGSGDSSPPGYGASNFDDGIELQKGE